MLQTTHYTKPFLLSYLTDTSTNKYLSLLGSLVIDNDMVNLVPHVAISKSV